MDSASLGSSNFTAQRSNPMTIIALRWRLRWLLCAPEARLASTVQIQPGFLFPSTFTCYSNLPRNEWQALTMLPGFLSCGGDAGSGDCLEHGTQFWSITGGDADGVFLSG
jgi:hypothetical protein